MPRAIASATISFGLVTIPVNVYPATEARAEIRFHWLHEKCGTRLKQQYYCPKDDEVVSRKDMIKGYELGKGRYVTFTAEELKALEEQATQTIEVQSPALSTAALIASSRSALIATSTTWICSSVPPPTS